MSVADFPIAPLSSWFPSGSRIPLISGPCSAETREQVLVSAKELAAGEHVSFMRAGVWKPRTRPNAFEGSGAIALEWLAEAKHIYKLPFAVEVANAEHVALAIEAGADLLWIGARTTVNPFSVQEIADALVGLDLPVMVKNPINPDINLWIGALERLHRAGIRKLAAIHRGFSALDAQPYRNSPRWEIAVQLKTGFPQLPLFCDPSHIAGKRSLVLEVAQNALDLAMDGLMIEAHPSPHEAWSDASQQLNFSELNALMNTLQPRQTTSEDLDFNNKLHQLRRVIDSIDIELLQLLAKRLEIIQDIGVYKQENNVTFFQPERWQEILQSRSRTATELGLDRGFIKRIMAEVHKEGLIIQARVIDRETSAFNDDSK
jgi:chorismate mutase